MEDNNENLSQTSPALQTSEKQGSEQKNTSKITTIILAILAIAGIGFGIYGMMRKPAETPVEDNTAELETELSNVKQKYVVLQNYVKELEASGTEVPEEAKSATEVEPTEPAVDTSKYIYIGEWGIKIKLPEELALVTYSYDYHGGGTVEKAGYDSSVCISGSEDHGLYAFSSVREAGSGLVCVRRLSEKKQSPEGEIEVYSDDSGWYYMSTPHAYYTEPDTMARGYEVNIAKLFNEHFSDSEDAVTTC